jgi:hypothetical protein
MNVRPKQKTCFYKFLIKYIPNQLKEISNQCHSISNCYSHMSNKTLPSSKYTKCWKRNKENVGKQIVIVICQTSTQGNFFTTHNKDWKRNKETNLLIFFYNPYKFKIKEFLNKKQCQPIILHNKIMLKSGLISPTN